jgi:hypothetical protein
MDTKKRNTTQISNEAKGIYKRLAQNHMSTQRFGRKSMTGKVFRSNPLKQRWSKGFYKTSREGNRYLFCTPDKLTKADIEKHLSPNQPRVYLENADTLANGTEVFLHPLVVDIDCSTEYQDARELAALVECWLYDNNVQAPCLALPSTNGKGCHLWMMMRRSVDMSAEQFNQLLGQVGNAMRAAISIHKHDATYLCRSGNPIKGSLSYEIPNPKFDPVLADSLGPWRSAKPSDRIEDIVKGPAEWVPVTSLDELERYSDEYRKRMVGKVEQVNLETLEGPVEQTWLEAYKRSKHYESFVYNEKLERYMVKRGTLIAFPCAGRRDLAPKWIEWYDDAIQHPITMEQVQTLSQLAPTEPAKANPRKQKAKQAKPEKKQHAGASNGQLTLDFHHGNRSMQRLADPGIQKHEAAYAAAQLALQQTNGNATEDDALELYESYGPATGERTPQRRTRIRGALELARRTYDPTKRSGGRASMSHWYGIPQLSFDHNDLKYLQEHAKHQWPDADQLNNLVMHRRLGYDQIAGVMAMMSKYTLTNPNGQISRDIIIKSLERLGLQLHKDVYQVIKRLLLDAQWLVMTDASWGKGRKAQCYAIGPNAPQMAWIDRYLQAMHVADEFIHSGSLPSINIDVSVCPDHEIEGAPILAMPNHTHSWCVDTFEMDDVFCHSA